MIAIRRSRTTRVIVKLLFVYLVCVIPICVFNLCEVPGKHKETGIALYCLYWLQYCVNNFIYVVSNGRYRCAYYQFLCWATCRHVPFPAIPSLHCQQRHCHVYNIQSSSTLQEPLDPRFRTPSECEEARRRADSIFFGSFSTGKSDGILKDEVYPNLSVSLSPDYYSSLRFYSSSLSSTSSLQTLIETKRRPRHFSHSVKRDLKAARQKLRRTFSC